MNITSAGNTEVPIIITLEQKGYDVTAAENGEWWTASKSGVTYRGESPSELLALIGMHEFRGDKWKATDEEIERCLNQYDGLG